MVSLFMNKTEKLITKMQGNPRDWSIEDIKIVAARYGFKYRQPGTSHVTFRADTGQKITIPARKPIKPVYVKKFLALIEGLGG
jgi:predicted RNA binding protein YcfA (HicA-like mRNA interferase family)